MINYFNMVPKSNQSSCFCIKLIRLKYYAMQCNEMQYNAI